jgi:chloride channel 3/4/5
MCYFSTPDQNTRPHHTHNRTSSLPIQIPTDTPLSPSIDPDAFPFEPVSSLDFGQYIDSVPLTIHPHLPLETVMEMFKKLGPRVVLVELRGRVCGLITVKDVLKYQFKVENEEHPRVERGTGVEERLWGVIEVGARKVGGLWGRIWRRPVLSETVVVEEEEVELVDQTHSPH